MAKRYYWFRVKDSDFETDSPFDFLLSQPCGAEYIVIYQMLVLKAVNKSGRLCSEFSGHSVPWNLEKITRELKAFPLDTVRVGIEALCQLGLMQREADGTLVIARFSELVGSECESAERVRRYRESRRERELSTVENLSTDFSTGNSTKNHENCGKPLHCNAHCNNNVTIEKEIDIRDKRKEIDSREEKRREEETPLIPSLTQLDNFISKNNLNVDAVRFFEFFAKRNWTLAGQLVNWQELVVSAHQQGGFKKGVANG